MRDIKFSFVIPMLNEMQHIERCLGKIIQEAQAHQHAEIIVVDNGSTDGCDDWVEERNIELIRVNKQHISTLRNLGAERATGEYLIFLDADIEIFDGFLPAVEQHFEELNADAFGYLDLAPDIAPWYAERWAERCLNRRNVTKAVDDLPGRNINVKKEFFDKVGGFDNTLVTGEDKDFIMRIIKAGAKIYSKSPEIVTHWGYEKSFKQWLAKEYWRQHNHPDLLLRHKFSFRVLRFPAIAMAVFFCAVLAIIKPALFMPFMFLSFLPALLITLKNQHSRRNISIFAQFVFLYWARFMVTAWSTLLATVEMLMGKK